MQIFVRHPSSGKTNVFHCDSKTTLEQLVQWVEDMIGWPSYAYYITHHGKPISYPYQQIKTFEELKIQDDDTLHLTGRMIPMYQH